MLKNSLIFACFVMSCGPWGGVSASAEFGPTCVQSILKPFQKVHFRYWKSLREICSNEIGEKTIAPPTDAYLQARVKRARLHYLLGDFDLAAQDVNVALALADVTDAALSPTVSASLALLDALVEYRSNGPEAALPKVRRISEEFPYYEAGHNLYNSLCIELELYDEAIVGLQRQARINPDGKAIDNLLFMFRQTQRFEDLRDTTLSLIDTDKKPYNIAGHLLAYTEALLNMNDLQPAGLIIDVLKGERLDRQNHSWQHQAFGAYRSLANKEVGFYLARNDRKKLREYAAFYYLQTNQPQRALEAMQGNKISCGNKFCMTLERDLAVVAGDAEKASRLTKKIENTKFGVKITGHLKWDRNMVKSMPESPFEAIGIQSGTPSIEHHVINETNGQVRIVFSSEQPLSFYDMRLTILDYAKSIISDLGASEMLVLSEGLSFRTRGAENALTGGVEFVDQRVKLELLPLTSTAAFDTAKLVPWRMVVAE